MPDFPYPPHPKNVPGDLYVGDGCCLVCDMPLQIAPDLFAYDDPAAPAYCYVKRQPTTEDEITRMVEAVHNSEVECIRYRGKDPDVWERCNLYRQDDPDPAPRRQDAPAPAPRRWWQFWRPRGS